MTDKADRMEVLDAMRGVAALLVVLFHVRQFVPLVASGYLAVDFFFVLSGLVIAQTYGHRLAGAMGFAEFARVRIIRMYPLFLVGLILAIGRALGQLAMHVPDGLSATQLVLAVVFELFMLPSPVDQRLFALNEPGWSLFFELLINLVYAAALVKANVKALVAFVVLAGLVLLVAAFSEGSLGTGFTWDAFHWGLARVSYSFAVGVLICRLNLHRRFRLGRGFFVIPLAALTAVLVVSPPAPYTAFYDAGVVLLMSPLLVVLGASCTTTNGFRPMARLLGDTSYAIYATHYPLLFMVAFAMRKLDIAPALWLPGFLLLMIALAALLNRFYDEPVRRWLLGVTRPRPTWATQAP